MRIVAIIPSRYGSTRLPGKPLLDLKGKSMIQRVYEQCKKCTALNDVYIATDDERIKKHVESFNAKVVLTSPNAPSGTDRCFEAVVNAQIQADYIINVQGDEPLIQPEQINELIEILDGNTELGTLVYPTQDMDEIQKNTTAKVVMNQRQEAMYFSRLPIPYNRDATISNTYYKHIGMYGYRNDILKKITQLNPSHLEQLESLEQLRWLENGFRVKCAFTKYETHSIDTKEDVDNILKFL